MGNSEIAKLKPEETLLEEVVVDREKRQDEFVFSKRPAPKQLDPIGYIKPSTGTQSDKRIDWLGITFVSLGVFIALVMICMMLVIKRKMNASTPSSHVRMEEGIELAAVVEQINGRVSKYSPLSAQQVRRGGQQ